MSAAYDTRAPKPEASAIALHRLDAEQALLGAILFDNETLNRIGPLAPEHFYDPAHQRIFAAIKGHVSEGKLADAITMKRFFMADGGIAEIGGSTYLMTLLDQAAPLSSQAQAYAEIIRDTALRREIAAIASETELAAKSDEYDSDAIIVEAERRLAELSDQHAPYGLWRSLGDVITASIDAAESGEARGLSTGLSELDEVTGGISTDGKLWVLGGASSMGKSLVGAGIAINLAKHSLALQYAGDQAEEAPFGVGYIHLEMGERGAGLRAATALAHDPATGGNSRYTDGNPTYLGARRQKLSRSGWDRLKQAAADARHLPLRIDARPHQTLSQIEAGAKRLQRLFARQGTPLRVLFIDHEGLIKSEQRRNAKWEEVSDRWVRLQGLAKKLNIAIVCLVQINRDGASKDGDQRPHMGHLANSADIERCADVICLLYREAYFALRKPDHACSDEDYAARRSNMLEIIVDKSRDGQRKTVKAILDVATGYLGESVKPEPRRV